MIEIKEVIVVEGRDDENAIHRAVKGLTIATHGFGIQEKTIDAIRHAYKTTGIIIFTDPDHAGELIRKRLTEKFPDAKQAYLTQKETTLKGDIGIENAKPEHVVEALEKAKCTLKEAAIIYTKEDLFELGLVGSSDSKERRTYLGTALGIGYSNGKGLLNKLNHYGIRREELITAWKNYMHQKESEK